MKIHDDEMKAACTAYFKDGRKLALDGDRLKAAIEAAYGVRKQRKAAKRERQEKDKQVVESVKPAQIVKGCGVGNPWRPVEQCVDTIGETMSGVYPSKAPEWDGNASAFDAAMKPKA